MEKDKLEMDIQASFHQGDRRFLGAGKQCMCNSLFAVLYSKEKNASEWTSSDLDTILMEGDTMYVNLRTSNAHLLVSELPTDVMFRDSRYSVLSHQPSSGALNCKDVEDPFISLEDSMKRVEKFALLTIGCYSVAILRQDDKMYMFDPHSRNELGMLCVDGKAILTKHKSVPHLCGFIRHLAATILPRGEHGLFELTQITVTSIEHEELCSSDDEFDGFSAISDGEYDCILYALNENLKETMNQIEENESNDDAGEVNLSYESQDTDLNNETDSSIDTSQSAEYTVTPTANRCMDSLSPIKPQREQLLNDSFIDEIILHGLANESNLSLDLLQDSESEDDVPLSSIREKVRTMSANATTAEPNTSPHLNRGRKRLRNENNWKRNAAKQLRNRGKSYVSTSGKRKPARSLKKGCGDKCKFKCHEKIDKEARHEIFHEFWRIGDVQRQRDYLSCWVTVERKKRTETQSSRNMTRKWNFRANGQSVRVCKTFFLDTLDISHTAVDTALQKGNKENIVSGICSPDKRGKHSNRVNKITNEKVTKVKQHIESFPKVESHYCRKDSGKYYLESGLSVPKMYNLYLNECTSNNDDPVSLYTYRYIFDRDFNLGFHKPVKDRCDLCARYENASEEEKCDMANLYTTHLQCKTWAREMKAEDKEKCDKDKEVAVACFDLQQILLTPLSNESVLYYSRNLCTYNLTLYDMGTRNGYCYLWNEAHSGRGPNEIASCVYRYLKLKVKQGKTKIILYSDNCGGQNRNRYFMTMLCHAKKSLNLKLLEHKFLERGHTQNENDSVHATIERASRERSIYTTPQWAATIRMARQNPKPYRVKELDSEDFLDFKFLSKSIVNLDFDTRGEKIKWMQIKVVSFESKHSELVKVTYNDKSSVEVNLNVRNKNTRTSTAQDFTLPKPQRLYSVPGNNLPKISASKYNDLVHLCSSNVIPRVHHNFFLSLRHEDNC